MSATTLNTARPDWYPGQVTVNAQSDFRVVLEGKATNGGMYLIKTKPIKKNLSFLKKKHL